MDPLPMAPSCALDETGLRRQLERYRQAEQTGQPGAVEDGYVAVRADCSEALTLQPDHFWARYVRAMCQIKLRNWADANTPLWRHELAVLCDQHVSDFPERIRR